MLYSWACYHHKPQRHNPVRFPLENREVIPPNCTPGGAWGGRGIHPLIFYHFPLKLLNSQMRMAYRGINSSTAPCGVYSIAGQVPQVPEETLKLKGAGYLRWKPSVYQELSIVAILLRWAKHQSLLLDPNPIYTNLKDLSNTTFPWSFLRSPKLSQSIWSLLSSLYRSLFYSCGDIKSIRLWFLRKALYPSW